MDYGTCKVELKGKAFPSVECRCWLHHCTHVYVFSTDQTSVPFLLTVALYNLDRALCIGNLYEDKHALAFGS